MPLRLALAALLLAAAPAHAQQPKTALRAGAHAQDVTPKKYPISVNGGMQDRLAKGAHDPLHARCLVLDDGTTKIAFVVTDMCMIPREVVDDARNQAHKLTGIPKSHILISATHTHTAPTLSGVFQSDPDPDYPKYLAQQIARGVEEAHRKLQPAKIGWAVGKDPAQIFNRRWFMKPGTMLTDPFGGTSDKVKMNPGYLNPGLDKPAGPTDPDVTVVAAQAPDGRPLALLANYGLHYVGGVEPLSADYFGAFADRMKQLLRQGDKSGFVAMMSNGTSGDVNNVNYGAAAPGKRQPFEQIRVVANSVANAALKAYQGISYTDKLKIAVRERDLELGVRLPGADDVKKAQAVLARAEGRVLKTLQEIYARETVLLAKYPAKVPVRVQAIRVGELAVVAIPCEVFAEIGLEIKKRSPIKTTFTISLANGYNGYLPTPEQHALGGYETWRARSSYLEASASRRITAALLEMLNELAK